MCQGTDRDIALKWQLGLGAGSAKSCADWPFTDEPAWSSATRHKREAFSTKKMDSALGAD